MQDKLILSTRPAACAVVIDDVHVMLGGQPVLNGIDLDVKPGEVVGILGPNGCGKSTLLRCIAGVLKPAEGRVLIDGEDVAHVKPHLLARRLAFQSQENVAALGYTVRDIVGMGRLAHSAFVGSESAADRRTVQLCMQTLEVAEFADRPVEALSGGERQRVTIARALAQNPGCLLLDEPTNHLDVRHQFSVLDQICQLGITVIVTLHDLQLAARVCDRIVLMRAGRVVALGTPEQTLTAERIAQVYEVGATVLKQSGHAGLAVHLFPLGAATNA